jgi:hypothetical protein
LSNSRAQFQPVLPLERGILSGFPVFLFLNLPKKLKFMGGDWKEMFRAAQEGDLELVKYHIKNGVDPNYQHPEYLTSVLIEAAGLGQEEVVAYLLEHGADPHAKAVMGGETALDAARIYKRKEVIQLLKAYLKSSG